MARSYFSEAINIQIGRFLDGEGKANLDFIEEEVKKEQKKANEDAALSVETSVQTTVFAAQDTMA